MNTDRLRAEDLQTEAISEKELAELANEAGSEVPGDATEQLKRDLERSAAPVEVSAWPPILEEPRRMMDTRHADPATSHRPLVGPALVLAKRSFRAVFQPFINEMLRRQVEFNEAILTSLAGIYEQTRVNARTQALWREEIAQRIENLEAAAGAKPGQPPRRPAPRGGKAPRRG